MTPQRLEHIRTVVAATQRQAGCLDDTDLLAECLEHIDQLATWIADLQSGMYINCVYCGHRYGPASDTPESKADLLKQHIAKCPEHPMSALLEAVKRIVQEDEAGEITGGAIEDCKQAIEKAEEQS